MANFTLNGLEEAIEKAVRTDYNVRQRGIYIGKVTTPDGVTKYKFLATNLTTVRFADDVVVLARSRRMIEKTIRPSVDEFLKERGL